MLAGDFLSLNSVAIVWIGSYFQFDLFTEGVKNMMSFLSRMKVRYGKLVAIVSLFTLLSFPIAGIAQNLGTAPAVGKAVQGQQATQVEGAVLNVVNWVCNVICPVIAAGCFVSAAFKYQAGRPHMSSVVGGGIFLAVSAVTRLIEYFIAQGTAGVGSGLHQIPRIFTDPTTVAALQHLVRNV